MADAAVKHRARTDVDDLAAPAAAHAGQNTFGHLESAVHVDAHDQIPLILG
ncbi:MAG: hypothetical protein WCO31_06830 [Actinomycetes bacterium]